MAALIPADAKVLHDSARLKFARIAKPPNVI